MEEGGGPSSKKKRKILKWRRKGELAAFQILNGTKGGNNAPHGEGMQRRT